MNPQPQNNNLNKQEIARRSGLSARFLALESLKDPSIKTLPTDRIGRLAEKFHVPTRERSLAYDLLAGTIKRRATLDHMIEVSSHRRTQQIDSTVLDILRLGIYQLLFEDTIPDFAAVDTSCELARAVLGKKPVGFVNAVLRNVQRAMAGRSKNDLMTQSLQSMTDPAKKLSIEYSYPVWLIKRWLGRWDEETLRRILSAGNGRPAMTLRPNPLRTTAEKLSAILTEQGCQVKLTDHGMLSLILHPPITELKAFADGLFQVQDRTAADVVRQLEVTPGMKILDLCAGLGTKTTQLAELAEGRAEIYASDTIPGKLEKLQQNAARLGLMNIKAVPIESLPEAFFDWVLLDVPCSNTGVFDRRPEARWRLKENDFATYAEQSLSLLKKAELLVTANGRIAFSTCSIDEEEDGQVIRRFCEEGAWSLAYDHIQLPEIDAETNRTARTGGYWAILRKC